jgi:hypothetical protein
MNILEEKNLAPQRNEELSSDRADVKKHALFKPLALCDKSSILPRIFLFFHGHLLK